MMHYKQAIGNFLSFKIIEKYNKDNDGRKLQVEHVVPITNEERFFSICFILTQNAKNQ